MNAIKKPLKQLLARLGYDVVPHRNTKPTPAPTLRRPNPHAELNRLYLKNFENLANAYEHLSNERAKSELIESNALRPQLLARLLGTPPAEAYFIIEALAKTKALPGDVCEFGVAQGETSALIANEIANTPKRLHLFDSFEGLPNPTAKDELKNDIFSLGSIEAYAGTMKSPISMVLERLQAISFPPSQYIIHKGFIETLIHAETELPSQVSFAYVDFDFYEPIQIALDLLHRVTPPGAMIVVDDYDFFSTGAKSALDEFLSEKNASERVYEMFVPDPRLGRFAIVTKLCEAR